MSDGAHMGITAGRALDTVLGGAEQPTEEERAIPEQARARIEAAPLFEGPKPYDGDKDSAYSRATDSLARAFLLLIEEDESLLEPRKYPDTYPNGSPMAEVLRGKPMDQSNVLWEAMKKRWPHADDWLGGASGFMVGFALNAALYAAEKEIAYPNPALIEVEIPEGKP